MKIRPCVVISLSEMHDHLRIVIVAPMTSASRAAPFRIGLGHGGRKGLILLDQTRVVDKTPAGKGFSQNKFGADRRVQE